MAESVSSCFSVSDGLSQGCAMPPYLFNIFIDKVVVDVHGRTQRRGVEMIDRDQKKWPLSHLLLADDMALVAESAEQLQCFVTKLRRVWHKLTVNVEFF